MFIHTHRRLPTCMYIYKWVFIYKIHTYAYVCASQRHRAGWQSLPSPRQGCLQSHGQHFHRLPNPFGHQHIPLRRALLPREGRGCWLPPHSAAVTANQGTALGKFIMDFCFWTFCTLRFTFPGPLGSPGEWECQRPFPARCEPSVGSISPGTAWSCASSSPGSHLLMIHTTTAGRV